jgi:hypothetical protein
MLSLNYDRRFDILSIELGDRRQSIGDEEYDGLLVLRDREKNNITGFTIFDFSRRYKDTRMPLFPENIVIDFERDVLPFIKS